MAKQDDLQINADEAAPKQGGSRSRLVIIAALVLVAAGGAGAFFLLGGDAEEAGTEAEVVEEPALEPLYADVSKVMVNLQHSGRTHYVQSEMQLMSYSADVIAQIERDMPAIRDTLIMLFNGQDFETLKTVDGKEALREAAVTALNDALGLVPPDHIDALYFETFILQ